MFGGGDARENEQFARLRLLKKAAYEDLKVLIE